MDAAFVHENQGKLLLTRFISHAGRIPMFHARFKVICLKILWVLERFRLIWEGFEGVGREDGRIMNVWLSKGRD